MTNPTITVLEQEHPFVAHCQHCGAATKSGKYTLEYKLGVFTFLIGRKETAPCQCGEETMVPLLFDDVESATKVRDEVIADGKPCDGIPSFPFVDMSILSPK